MTSSFDGLATGTFTLDLNCTSSEGSDVCIPKATSTGARPDWRIQTKIQPDLIEPASSSCADNSKKYQSWQVDNWRRRFEMVPSSLPAGTAPSVDTGPSFSLKNIAKNETFVCTTAGKEKAIFQGSCASSAGGDGGSKASFTFDPVLNYLTVKQAWACGGDGGSFEATGVVFMQGTCDRVYNTNEFTCTSLPVWIGTKTVK